MNVTIENLAPCKRLVRVEIEPQKVDAAFATASDSVLKAVKLPGFRPGKAPKDLVRKQFSNDIMEEARRQLVNEAWPKALEQEKLEVVTRADFQVEECAQGKPFVFKAPVELAPQFSTPVYKGLAAKREKRVVVDADVERALQLLREQRQTFEDTDGAAETGKIVVVNYTATSDGKPLTEFAPTARGLTEKKDFWMEIKEGSFIPGFTEQLVGAAKGDKRTVNIEFPQDFVSKPLSGLKAAYEVEITAVKTRILPALDDAFAQFYGAQNLEALKEGVRTDLAAEIENAQRRAIREQVLKTLNESTPFDVPQSLVDYETRETVYSIAQENMRRGVPKEALDADRDKIYAHAVVVATEKVRMQFLLQRVAREEKIEATREELSNRLAQIAEANKVAIDKVVKDYAKNDGFKNLAGQIILEKALQVVVDSAVVEDVEPAPAKA